MGRQANETKPIKHICAGLLAHVSARGPEKADHRH